METFNAYIFGVLAAIVLGSYLVLGATVMIQVQTVKPNIELILTNAR